MSPLRTHILRIDALLLAAASITALHADILGAAFGIGPQAGVLATAPHAAIGFVEAHGLALIFALLFWRDAGAALWHGVAAAVHTLLALANLAFWSYFVASNAVTAG